MGRITALLHRFNAGEVSRAALSRVDQERIRLHAERQENIFPYVIGKGLFRPGTSYITQAYNNERTRLIAFVKSMSATAILEFGNEVMRAFITGEIVERPAVTAAVTNGDMGSSTGWTLTTTGNATSSISGGVLTMACTGRGSTALAKQEVTVNESDVEHALRIIVTRGPVTFECGSSDGVDDYVIRTTLYEGYHSLGFTPTGGSFWFRFSTLLARSVIVDSITIEPEGEMELPTPWGTDVLRNVRFDQSLDVMFAAEIATQQYRIERRGFGRGWSVVKYYVDDGPFHITSVHDANVKLTPALAYGNTTLTATRALFLETDVGSIFETTSSGANATFILSALDFYTEPVRLSGIGTENDFSVVTTGTWTMTLSVQRSLDGPDTGFTQIATITTNTTTSVATGTEFNNVICWYRVGVSAYTSGNANVQIVAGSVSGGSGDSSIITKGIYRVTSLTSSTVANVEVLKSPVSLASTTNWRRGDWSDRRGWPSAVAFYDGRLWWARDDRFWGSVSGNYHSFDTSLEGDNASVLRDIATGGTHATTNWILPLQRLMFGTTGAEVSARSSSFDEPITPTNITLRDASTNGSAAVAAIKMDGRGIYVQRSGHRIYEASYDLNSNDYTSINLTRFNEDIGFGTQPGTVGFVELAVQRQPETYIWAVRDDGVCPILIYEPKEEVMGWVKFISADDEESYGEVQSVAVVPTSSGEDRVYMNIKRTIDGSTVYYIERLAFHNEAHGVEDDSGPVWKLADSHVFEAGPTATVTLDHLEGQTVIAMGSDVDGNFRHYGEYTVASGVITLSETAYNVCAGLPYDGFYKSSKLAYGARGGTAINMIKRVGPVGVVLQDTHPDALSMGPDFDDADSMHELPRVEDATDIDEDTMHTYYDKPVSPFASQYDADSRLCVKINAGYPATLTAITMSVETNE